MPDDIVRVIPAINSNFTHHIAAGLADGSVIVGQNSISHPSEHTALEAPSSPLSPGSKKHRSRLSLGDPEAILTDDEIVGASLDSDHELRYRAQADPEHEEDANLPGSLATLRKPNIKFSKSYSHNSSSSPNDDLPSRIERLWYINPYGQEISPPPNPRVCEAIRSAQAIIYSIGSLYTSIIPSIVLRGVGEAIRKSPAARTKILILNGSLDREVGPRRDPFTALDFVEAIVRAGEESRGVSWRGSSPPRPDTLPPNEVPAVGVTLNGTPSAPTPTKPNPQSIHSTYITHLIHLSGPAGIVPHVDAPRLRALGIHTVKVYGRKIEEMGPDAETVVKGMTYDPEALKGALETILGRRGMGVLDSAAAAGEEAVLELGPVGRGLMSRRNTLDA